MSQQLKQYRWQYISKEDHQLNLTDKQKLFAALETRDIESWNYWRQENKNRKIYLDGINLSNQDLSNIDLTNTYLRGASLYRANLTKANLIGASIQGAYLSASNLSGALLEDIDLRGIRARGAAVDGQTLFFNCLVDNKTDLTGVGLANARIDPALRSILEYNIRKISWNSWYRKGSLFQKVWKRLIVQPFWMMSDYGFSTSRLIKSFFLFAFLFALIYYVAGIISYPGIIDNLFIVNGEALDARIVPLRAIYFSIVTMTTLGFGDLHATATSAAGHLLLIIQVLVGYMLLGALITRLAIMFTAGGPSEK
ncbi:MAG: hypothetical protein D6B28_04990 [Gammaproteobacteria bacterium]|nr:MAG: hypothetical protein D6B28_04990 [Gammaproteobacteria bacterium]